MTLDKLTYNEDFFVQTKIRWIFVALFFFVTLVGNFDLGETLNNITPVLSVVVLFIASILHGTKRYGLKNIAVFFAITWIVSLFFEALSIRTGFPFGHYYYDKLIGPRILDVPLVIMLGYFGMAYFSWILSHVLLGQYSQKLTGGMIFLIPLIGTFIMVFWDLCMDPLSSTIGSLWVWKNGGSYFGVPLQNYFGWFFVVFIFFQIFALYISKYDEKQPEIFLSRSFWLEAASLYGIQGLSQVASPFTISSHSDIYGPMALVAFFTMMFVTLLSFIFILRPNFEIFRQERL